MHCNLLEICCTITEKTCVEDLNYTQEKNRLCLSLSSFFEKEEKTNKGTIGPAKQSIGTVFPSNRMDSEATVPSETEFI